MITEEICTYEVCKLAKEKGFPQDPDKNDHCLMYCWDGLRNIHPLAMWIVWEMEEYDHDNLYAAPSQTLLQRWLREENEVYIEVYIDWEDSVEYDLLRYSWRINTTYGIGEKSIGGYSKNESEEYFDSYELALEDALAYSLKNLI